MYNDDIALRQSDSNDPLEISDRVRRKKVLQLLAEDKIVTDNDKFHAAYILNHTGLVFCDGSVKSVSAENYYLAYQLAKSSFENGNEEARYFTAAFYDRYLLYTKGFQKYGTQRVFEDNQELWAPIDPLTTDEEREHYGIESLKELLKKHKMKSGKN